MKQTKKEQEFINRILDALKHLEIYEKLPLEMETMMKNSHLRHGLKKQ